MEKLALALGGGGARGAYEIGVWKALREMDLHPEIVTGVSVGALNGAMVAQGDYELASQLWSGIETKDVMDLKLSDSADGMELLREYAGAAKEIVLNKGADTTPLYELLCRYIDEEKIRSSPVDFGLITVAFPEMKPLRVFREDMPAGSLVRYLMASSAFFPAMQAQVIDGVTYVDGGIYDNVPVKMAIARGAQRVIAVNLKAPGLRKKYDPSVPVLEIAPKKNLGAVLEFSPENSRQIMSYGYYDTLKTFGRLEGAVFTFEKGTLNRCAEQLETATKLYCALRPERFEKIDVLRMRLLRKFRGRVQDKGAKALALAALETVGEVLSLPEGPVYDLNGFLLAARDACRARGGVLGEQWEALLRLENAEKVRETLKETDKKEIAASFAGLIRKNGSEKRLETGAWLLASVFPEEFLTGMFAALIEWHFDDKG